MVGRTQKEIEAIDIGTTKVDAKVGDLFKVRVGDPRVVHFEGGSERFDLLGAKLLPGFTIHVEGDVGAQLGRGAQGGTITIAGDAGAFAASGMTGGQIDIGGDAAIFSARRWPARSPAWPAGASSWAAMRAKERATVCGAASSSSRATPARISARASSPARSSRWARRRGESAISTSGRRSCWRRGGDFGPTYVDCGAHHFTFARLFSRALTEDSRRASRLLSQKLRRFAGDTGVLGKGEILTPV